MHHFLHDISVLPTYNS